MHQADEVKRVPIDPIANVVGKGAAVFAGESMGADMISAFPSDNRSYRVFDSLVEVTAEPVGNRIIPGLGIQQILLEKR